MLAALLGYLMISPVHFAKFPLLSFNYSKSNSIMLMVFILSFIGMITLRGLFLLPLCIVFISWNTLHWFIFVNRKNSLSSKVQQ
jgi:phosphatidylserine synthase